MVDAGGGCPLIRRLRAVGVQLAPIGCTATAGRGAGMGAGLQQLSAQRLGSKVCLVTGGASGIGKAICVQLAREGATVIAFDVRRAPREGGEDVISLMRAARQSESLPVQQDLFIAGDVSDADSVQGAIVTTVDAFGRLDVLVNNAAKMNGHSLLDTSEEEWDDIMAVNAKGVFLFSKAAVTQFLEQPRHGPDGIRGRIVNISSQHGSARVAPPHCPTLILTANLFWVRRWLCAVLYCPGNVAYGTSKAAVAYLTKQVGSEYIQDGIVVNAVAPGRILTGRPGSRIEGARVCPVDPRHVGLSALVWLPAVRQLSLRHYRVIRGHRGRACRQR